MHLPRRLGWHHPVYWMADQFQQEDDSARSPCAADSGQCPESHYAWTPLQCEARLSATSHSHLQPLDAGIIKSFNSNFKKQQLRHVIDQLDEGRSHKVSVSDAIRFTKNAWYAVSATTIINRWQQTTRCVECYSTTQWGPWWWYPADRISTAIFHCSSNWRTLRHVCRRISWSGLSCWSVLRHEWQTFLEVKGTHSSEQNYDDE